MKKPVTLACFILADLICSVGHAIVGGKTPEASDPIAKVTVQVFNQTATDDCSGVKIAPHYILTAGHCHTLAKVVHLPSGETDHVTSVLLYKNYKPSITIHTDGNTEIVPNPNEYDFAILKVAEKLPPPYAAIADKNTTPKPNDDVMIAGFGDTVPGVDSESGLHKLRLVMDDANYSRSAVSVYENGRSGACAGDSGGPGYEIKDGKVIVWGVDSGDTAPTWKLCESGEIYSKTAAVRNWIESTIQDDIPNADIEPAGAITTVNADSGGIR